jgi:MFS family permease
MALVHLQLTWSPIPHQGIVGSIPWMALVYVTLYLQLLGMSDFQASLLMALFLGATAVGGLLGGAVGDRAAERWPNHGRIAVTQFSVFIGIPFSLILLKVRHSCGTPAALLISARALPNRMGPALLWFVPLGMRTAKQNAIVSSLGFDLRGARVTLFSIASACSRWVRLCDPFADATMCRGSRRLRPLGRSEGWVGANLDPIQSWPSDLTHRRSSV